MVKVVIVIVYSVAQIRGSLQLHTAFQAKLGFGVEKISYRNF